MPKKKIPSPKTYGDIIKERREAFFETPYNLAYQCFDGLGFTNQDTEFFMENASSVIERMREACWNAFLPKEREFMSKMLSELITDDAIAGKSPREAIEWFVESFPKEIYDLSLSNTQSRRSRAGKEFEAIIELVLMGAGIPLDSQGNIGKKIFVEKGLGKLVDVVSPGVAEYLIDKSDVVLISAKTTLRERWQEVPEEMSRTGAKEMFLATLDTAISDEVLATLYESNIRVTTTKSIKNECYADNVRVLTFERLLKICSLSALPWSSFSYTDEQKEAKLDMIQTQIDKHQNHKFVLEHYAKMMQNLMKNG